MNQEEIAAAAIIAGRPPMTDVERINQMPHIEMCRLWRFAPVGHPYFRCGTPESEAFELRYKNFGGMTPEISKLLGWEAT